MNPEQSKQLSEFIKSKAKELGFDACGIAKADMLKDDEQRFGNWLSEKNYGGMEYMKNNLSKRLDPRLLQEGTISVISLLLNYYPPHLQPEGTYKIGKYSYGQDYHQVIKNKLDELERFIKQQTGEVQMRSFTDSAPILEKSWAVKSGLGWVGKNSILINKKIGSFCFIAEIFINLELEYDIPFDENLCSNCTKCINACPTGAIKPGNVIDARKCISHLSQRSEDIPLEYQDKLNGWIWGCDICQDVCPWNKNPNPHSVDEFLPTKGLLNLEKKDWEDLTEEQYDRLFKNSLLGKTKFKILKRNIKHNHALHTSFHD